jgi:hypothetical protein
MSRIVFQQTEAGTLEASCTSWSAVGMAAAGEFWTLDTKEALDPCPSAAGAFTLSQTLQASNIPQKCFLSPKLCREMLTRSAALGKTLPPTLKEALTLIASQT